jgi:hypothetical protein
MPVSLASPATGADLGLSSSSSSSSFAAFASPSTSSLSSSVTLSQAKTYYNQAARNFLHRRHTEAIIAAEKALLSFQSEGLQDHSLAERLLILRLTLLATIYRPNEQIREDKFAVSKAGGKPLSSSQEDQAVIDSLKSVLSLPPLPFLSRLWVDVLRLYVEVLPRLPSIQARTAPSLFQSDSDTSLPSVHIGALPLNAIPRNRGSPSITVSIHSIYQKRYSSFDLQVGNLSTPTETR